MPALSIKLAALASTAFALDNGFGRQPVMGFNTYNDIGCSPNQSYVSETIDGLESKGFLKAGYNHFQVDCGWQGYERQSNGSITYDPEVFPDGIAPLSKYAIEKGFKWAMYTDQGVYSCDTKSPATRQGSLGYEKQDALQLAAWNVEYMKVDNCYITPDENAPKDPRTDFVSRYGAMSEALLDVGIPGIAICQWGTPYSTPDGLQGPAQWTPPLSNSYRVSDDIAQGWPNVMRIMNQGIHVNLKNLSGPGRWSDMDMLEVGNPGLTIDEQASHFAIWSMFKSTLMVSTHISTISRAARDILLNKDLISINQDSAGLPVELVQRFTGDHDVFAGGLENGDRAVLILDQSNSTRNVSIDFALLGIASATVKDLWSGRSNANITLFNQQVNPHGSVALRLSNIKFLPQEPANITWIQAESGTLEDGADVQDCSGCSGSKKVGSVYSDRGSVTFSDVYVSSETQDVVFDYINCEIGYLADQGPNVRKAAISVNGGVAQVVEFPLTGYNWERDLLKGYRVRLHGFNADRANIIKITGTQQDVNAPDFDRLGFTTS